MLMRKSSEEFERELLLLLSWFIGNLSYKSNEDLSWTAAEASESAGARRLPIV